MLDHKITKIVQNVKKENLRFLVFCSSAGTYAWLRQFCDAALVAHDCLLKSVELRMRSAGTVVTCAPGGEGASVTIRRSTC